MTLECYLVQNGGTQLDNDRNKALELSAVTLGSHRKLWWRCEKGHSWEATVYSVTIAGCSCPYCSGLKAIPGENDMRTLHPELMTQWDYDKNAQLPETVLPGSHEKAWWRCEKGHSWQAMPFSRTKEKGSGCPYCTGKKVLVGFNDLQSLRPKLAKEWHCSLNGELEPTDVTLGSNKKVWWCCGEGHVWQAAVYSRTRARASGCPVCAGVVKTNKKSTDRKRRTMKRQSSTEVSP